MNKSIKFSSILLFIPLSLLTTGCAVPQASFDKSEQQTIKAIELSADEISPATPASAPLEPTEMKEEIMPEPTATPVPKNEILNLPGEELFTFTSSEAGWYTVNDDVMGGVSRSNVEIADPDILKFTGNMSLENNGGFASIRSDWNILDLSNYDGILMRVKGDGNIYRFRIRAGATGQDVSYNALFETTADTWELVFVPFSGMIPTYRGFVLDIAPLDPSDIGSFGFMLSDKQDGTFELSVDWMRAISIEDVELLNSN